MTIVTPPQVVTDYLRHIPRLELDRAGFLHLDAWLGRSQDPAFLDVHDDQRILAAAAVIDRNLNGTPLALPDDLLEAIDRLDIRACQARTGLAAQAVWAVSHHQIVRSKSNGSTA